MVASVSVVVMSGAGWVFFLLCDCLEVCCADGVLADAGGAGYFGCVFGDGVGG